MTFIPTLEHLKSAKLHDFSSHFLLLFVIHNVCEGKGQKGHRKRTNFFFMFGSVERLGVIVFLFWIYNLFNAQNPIIKNKFYMFFLVFLNRFHRRKKTITFHHTTPPNTHTHVSPLVSQGKRCFFSLLLYRFCLASLSWPKNEKELKGVKDRNLWQLLVYITAVQHCSLHSSKHAHPEEENGHHDDDFWWPRNGGGVWTSSDQNEAQGRTMMTWVTRALIMEDMRENKT